MQRRVAGTLLLGMLTVLVVGLLAVPASAEITKGNCRGSATFPEKASDNVLDADRPQDMVFEAPTSATVSYAGDLGPGATPSAEEVPFSGSVKIALPLGTATIASWSGETTDVSDSGGYTYDIPGPVPKGTGAIKVTATHKQEGHPDCEAIVLVTLEGSPGAAAWTAAALTAVAGAGTVAAGRKKKA